MGRNPDASEIIPESGGAIISEQRGGFIGIGNQSLTAQSLTSQPSSSPAVRAALKAPDILEHFPFMLDRMRMS